MIYILLIILSVIWILGSFLFKKIIEFEIVEKLNIKEKILIFMFWPFMTLFGLVFN